MSHEEKYEQMCQKYGVAWSKESPKRVGETLESLREKHKKDRHLNNVPLDRWDRLAVSFLAYNYHSGLSMSEVVCMEKHAAIKLLKETENE